MEHVISAISSIIEIIEGYMGLDGSMKDLETQVNQLSHQLTDLETMLLKSEREGKRKRKREVESWIEQAKELIYEFPILKERIRHGQFWKKLINVDCVKRMKEEVKELRDECRNIGELTVDVDESKVPPLVVPGRTSNNNLEKIYRCLQDENVSSIGLYGIGGVGKTTLVKHIYNCILQKMPQLKVYWVTVSQDFSIKKLQDDIAKIASLELSDTNEERRAAILSKHLVGKNVVLILDDVQDYICLEKLGNPLGVEGCKLIITTRSRKVCRRICQKSFKIDVLNENETWNLFEEILLQHDNTVLTDAIEELAKSLVEMCGGLPLELITVAESMRGVNDVYSWRHAITEFQKASLQVENMHGKRGVLNTQI